MTATIVDFSRVDENSKPSQSTVETDQGTLHLQPLRKKGSKNLRALVTFVPRASTFDRENTASSSDPFRGFFTLFWVSVCLFFVTPFALSLTFPVSGIPSFCPYLRYKFRNVRIPPQLVLCHFDIKGCEGVTY
jgi:hypothetical protein